MKDASQKADEDVKHANKGYDDFMAKYNAYKSDLKRRGHGEVPTVRKDAGKLRRSSEGSEESDRKSESSNKETKGVDK